MEEDEVLIYPVKLEALRKELEEKLQRKKHVRQLLKPSFTSMVFTKIKKHFKNVKKLISG